jgi:hypothetical protein
MTPGVRTQASAVVQVVEAPRTVAQQIWPALQPLASTQATLAPERQTA